MKDYTELGEGYYLEYLDFEGNINKYSYLYKDGIKLSDKVFRKGGIGGKFKDGYIELLVYLNFREKFENNSKNYNKSFWAIINYEGDIVMQSDNQFGHDVSHLGGIIAKMKDNYYNLETGEIIAIGSYSNTVKTEEFLFVSHRYDWYDKEGKFPLGVYKINYYTAEIEFFPEKMKSKIIKI